jgi:molybdopterin synthase catalytic subunit
MTEKKKHKVFIQGAITPTFIADSIAKHSGKTTIGAHDIFLGQVRNDLIDHKTVASIEYSAYEEMAENLFHEIREAIFVKYDIVCMHIYHSLGVVKTGEICLFVFTSSKHRKNAMAACEFMVDEIKSELPIWGKEIFQDNTSQWKENKSL